MDWSKNQRITQAAASIQHGGVIAYPTESVWGLGCDPYNEQAVRRLLALKDRPVEKGLIIVASGLSQIEPLLEGLNQTQLATLNTHWPGPYTYLIPNDGFVPQWVTGEHPSIAVRVSAHPLVGALCERVGHPIVSTSANPAGLPAAADELSVRRYFGDKLDDITPGETQRLQKPSEIRDLITGTLIRAGG
ncbi:L-threonylcarbamoyladenylate synthase [Aurantivibrio plasticivorans]